MSDFLNLNITDEVIDGEPKYKVTDNDDGTKNITLANTIIEEGTALNKNFFENTLKPINNVMGYNAPSYEIKNEDMEMSNGSKFYSSDINSSSAYKNGSSVSYRVTQYEDSDSTISITGSETYYITTYVKLENTNSFQFTSYYSTNYSGDRYSSFSGSCTMNFSNPFSTTQMGVRVNGYYSSSYPATFQIYVNNNLVKTITQTSSAQYFALGSQKNISSIQINVTCGELYGLIYSSSGNCVVSFGTLSDTLSLPALHMNSDISNTITNHIEKIKVPSGTFYKNYLNEKVIDTLLTPNTYYDLIYNGTKYIAYEKN